MTGYTFGCYAVESSHGEVVEAGQELAGLADTRNKLASSESGQLEGSSAHPQEPLCQDFLHSRCGPGEDEEDAGWWWGS